MLGERAEGSKLAISSLPLAFVTTLGSLGDPGNLKTSITQLDHFLKHPTLSRLGLILPCSAPSPSAFQMAIFLIFLTYSQRIQKFR